jgi:type I restriction enzyme S subunit
MARAKKEAALTPEERLQAALVPDWEWPYKLPENWCWLKLVESFDNHTDSKKKIKQKDYLVKGKLAVVDQGQELIGGYTNDVEKSYSGALPIVIFGDHTRCIKFVDFPFAQGADGVKVLRPKPFYLPKAFYYALQSVNIPNLGYRRHFPLFNKFSIPLPPFAEQQRIVDRIESLFAKLDEAKEKAQAVVDSFETRKAAILHKAFTGELTAKWREEHGVGMDSWEKKSVGELCISLKYGTAKKSDASGNVVVLRMGNLRQGEIDWSDLAYSNDSDDIEKYKLFSGDVLFNRTNSAALVGKTAIYRGEHPAIYAGYLIKLDYDHDKIIGDYLNYALNTLDAKKYCNSVKTDGVNQSNINAKKIGAYSFNVPSIPEQEKIVSVIQKLLSKEQQAKEAAEAVLDQIDLMKKSILARAFRGELGTNDPSDESAVELLKEIIRRG